MGYYDSCTSQHMRFTEQGVHRMKISQHTTIPVVLVSLFLLSKSYLDPSTFTININNFLLCKSTTLSALKHPNAINGIFVASIEPPLNPLCQIKNLQEVHTILFCHYPIAILKQFSENIEVGSLNLLSIYYIFVENNLTFTDCTISGWINKTANVPKLAKYQNLCYEISKTHPVFKSHV